MKVWDPKALWNEVKRAFSGTEDDDRQSDEQSGDPTLLFHMMFTAPLLLGLIMMARRG